MFDLPLAAYCTDKEGYITSHNERAASLWGQHPPIGSVRWCGAWRLMDVLGNELPKERSLVAVVLNAHEEFGEADVIMERPDGSKTRIHAVTKVWRKGSHADHTETLLMKISGPPDYDIEKERLAAIVSSSEDIIIAKKLDGTITSWNASATRILGYGAEEMIGQSISKIIPPELMSEELEIIQKLSRGEKVEHFDTERVSKSGRRVPLSVTISPLKDRAQVIIGASKIARDITERKKSELLQRRLFDELNHRVKNTLATVLALAKQSARQTTDPSTFAESFTGRVQSLARVHDLLVRGKLVGSDLESLIQAEVLPNATRDARVSLNGPYLVVAPKASGQLGLILHELASNARRHGSLSCEDGHLAIRWEILRDSQDLHIEWTETNLKGTPSLARAGFGISLIEQTIASAEGFVKTHLFARALKHEIWIPLSRAAAKDAGFDVGSELGGTWD